MGFGLNVSCSRHRHRRRQCKPSILFLVLTIATGGIDLVAQGEASILISGFCGLCGFRWIVKNLNFLQCGYKIWSYA
nr:hypothetical protein CFP56_14224 [Quercus suber]